MKSEESQIVKDFKEILGKYDYDMEDLNKIWFILMDKVTPNNKLNNFYEDERYDVVNDSRSYIPKDSYLKNNSIRFKDHYDKDFNK